MTQEMFQVPPEARVIKLARKAAGLTADSAAAVTRAGTRKGISASYWRDVERGRGGRRGQVVRTRASDAALAAMASAVRVSPEQLEEAASEHEDPGDRERVASAARILREILRQQEDAPPAPHAPPAALDAGRESRLPAAGPGLRPYVQGVLRDLYAAVGILGRFSPGRELPDPSEVPGLPELLDNLPGALAFSLPHEAVLWDSESMDAARKIDYLARIRRVAGQFGGGEQQRGIILRRG
jgi:transcriptional regulator with XRE-family HTH domain